MAYVAAVQAYGVDPEDVAESGGVPSPDPAAPESVHVAGVASETTRNWLTGLEVSPRGSSSPILKLHGVDVPTVDNLIAGTNVSLVKTGRDVTISASGGGGGGGGGAWGDITGTLSDQTDLQAALDAKAGLTTALGIVAHGATASTARPSGYTVVQWVGTVEPENMVAGDIWLEVGA